MVTTLPLIVIFSESVEYVTGRPDDADAERVNGSLSGDLSSIGVNEIVLVALFTTS